MPDKQTIAIRVAIQRPLYKLLDYSCDSANQPLVGSRVSVPLGNFAITGIVVEVDVESEFAELKAIHQILDSSPLLDATLMSLLQWASRYYHYPIGEVLFHALPNSLRKGKKPPQLKLWSINSEVQSEIEINDRNSIETVKKGHPPTFKAFFTELGRSPKQQQIALFLTKHGESDAIQLSNEFGDNWRTAIKQLIKKNFVQAREVEADFFPDKTKPSQSTKNRLTLTDEQQHCVESIQSYFTEDALKPILLNGITGSGKTEVYLRSIETLLDIGKQILVLVPEIGLTPQLLQRFQQHFSAHTTVSLHSGLADGDRARAWLGAKSGSIDIIIGTRSAIFTPMANLGAIIIDEEHDASFKQQEGFLYQGRDMAIKRAFDAKIPILLGSATPSLESLHNADLQRYHYLKLKSRPGSSRPPELALQDIRTLPLEAGISSLLMTEIRQHLERNNQVMLFLNRRGFSPVLMCPDCGWHASCNNCDMGMTYHAAAAKIICHHCALEVPVSIRCPECARTRLTTLGQGTERIEAVLKSHFPETPIIRIDRDSTSRKGSLEKKLDKVHQGEPVILVGTQMLTKGHDFPKLTLVGILDVDQALFSVDYRAQERLAQQVLQVAGRAGRGRDKGKVILQTSQPQHPMLLSLLAQGYEQTAQQILNERTLWNYPPLGSQALIRVNAETQSSAKEFIAKLTEKLKSQPIQGVDLLGPTPSPLAKRANRYRYQLLLAASNRGELHHFLNQCLGVISSLRKTGGVRWSIDVDPLDFS